jgi:tetratricopeptide (TPR) repeat protein
VVTGSILALFVLAAAQTESNGLAEFERGNEFFEAGEYDLALPYFQKAYELSDHRPSTIRALAQCERAMQLYDEAIAHFQEYLDTSPDEAAQIEKTLELLEEARRKKKREAAAKPPPPPALQEPGAPRTSELAVAPPPPPPPPAAVATEMTKEPEGSGVGWTILWISLGVAAVVGGGVAIGVALSGEEDPYGGTEGVVLGMR